MIYPPPTSVAGKRAYGVGKFLFIKCKHCKFVIAQ